MTIAKFALSAYDKGHSNRVPFAIGNTVMVIRDAIAYDASLRRKMRNKARRNGDPMGLLDNNQGGKVDNLLATYTRAKDRVTLLNKLSKENTPEARKLYKQLQNHWYNRGQSVGDYACEGKPVTKGKEKRRGKSMPLIKSF